MLRVFQAQFARLATIPHFAVSYKYTNDATKSGELPAGSKEVTTTVSSLRIDNIASAGLNISRR